MADRETVIRWIGSLLLKAADPSCPEAERQLCQEKAEALMLRYKIERAEADRNREKKSRHIVDVVMTGISKGSWQHILVDALSKAFDTMWVFTKSGEFQVLIGEKEDVRDTMNLFLYLTTEICGLSLTHTKIGDTFEQKEAFCIGCSMKVSERIHEFYARVVHRLDPECRALMVSKGGEIADYVARKFNQNLAEQQEKIANPALDKAFLDGYRAGLSVDIAGDRKLKEEAAHV